MPVIIHADDFGITPEQSRRILECCADVPGGRGVLNSLSVFANSPRFDECAELLDGRPDVLRVGVHLNFVEGTCCADPAEVPLLVDGRGRFRLGYGGLLAGSFGSHASELSHQLEVEAATQVARVVRRFPELAGHLRLDAHQHTQLIPAVFSAVLAVAQRPEYHLDYLRIPVEPALTFLAASVVGSIKPVNWVKHVLLNFLWARDHRMLAVSGLPAAEELSAVFCGVLFSGHMDERRVCAVLPSLLERSRQAGTNLELLFHPGRVSCAEDCLNPELPGFVAFSCGEGRDVEHDALRSSALSAALEGAA